MVSSVGPHRAKGLAHQIVRRAMLQVDGIEVEVVYKAIKAMHLRVYPSGGSVVVSVPAYLTDEQVRAAVVKRMAWIRRQRERIRRIQSLDSRELVARGLCRVWGRTCRLDVIPWEGKPTVERSDDLLIVRSSVVSSEHVVTLLEHWYRVQLLEVVPKLLATWEPVIGVKASSWGIRRMKTRWGTCNTVTAKIWINLELAKHHPDELEYVVVHELSHLHENNHGPRFRSLLDSVMPDWRQRQDCLNGSIDRSKCPIGMQKPSDV